MAFSTLIRLLCLATHDLPTRYLPDRQYLLKVYMYMADSSRVPIRSTPDRIFAHVPSADPFISGTRSVHRMFKPADDREHAFLQKILPPVRELEGFNA